MSDTTVNQPQDEDAPDYATKELAAYRFRRWVYVACTTSLCIALAAALALFRSTGGDVVQHAVDGFITLAETVVVTYLGASVVDRSNILSSLGTRFSGGAAANALNTPPNPPPTKS